MSYRLHPEAQAELAEAAQHYATEASPGVARAFLLEFERVVAVVAESPQIGTLAKHGLRKYPFKRFPYSVIYREGDGQLVIYAVAHHRRRPTYWKGRPGS